MGIKNLKGAVSIENFKGRIRLRWRYQKKRYSLYVAAYTKQNLLQAKKVVVQIEQDITTGQFDSTLNTYKPAGIQTTPIVDKTIIEYFEEWVRDYRNMCCDRDIDYHFTRSMLHRYFLRSSGECFHLYG
jgi:integrase